jgi:hypothetical protein
MTAGMTRRKLTGRERAALEAWFEDHGPDRDRGGWQRWNSPVMSMGSALTLAMLHGICREAVVAELGGPDSLGGGPLTYAEVARLCGLSSPQSVRTREKHAMAKLAHLTGVGL